MTAGILKRAIVLVAHTGASLLVVLGAGCGDDKSAHGNHETAPVSMYYNGPILTMAATQAQAVAVRNGRIAMLGPPDQIRARFGDAVQAIDLRGKSVCRWMWSRCR